MLNDCKYCNLNITEHGREWEGQSFAVGTSAFDLVLLKNLDSGETYITSADPNFLVIGWSKPVHYCPMCGRKLDD